MSNPNDIVRDAILRFLYSMHQKARSPKSAGLKISELTRALKTQGYKQQQVGSNLDYLVQKGWVREVVEMRSFRTPRGTMQQAEKRTYKVSDSGIDRLESASMYKHAPASTHINVSNVNGVTVIGDGNVVNTTFTGLSKILADTREAVLSEPTLSEEDKLSAVADIESLQSQLQKPKPDKTVIERLWSAIERLATVGGVAELIKMAHEHIGPLLK